MIMNVKLRLLAKKESGTTLDFENGLNNSPDILEE